MKPIADMTRLELGGRVFAEFQKNGSSRSHALRGNASPTRYVIELKPADADVTEFNSVTSLVNSDLLARTTFKLVRDYKIPNQSQNSKWKFLHDQADYQGHGGPVIADSIQPGDKYLSKQK